MKIVTKFLLVFAFLSVSIAAYAQTAKVQIVHSSPYFEVDTVIVYVNNAVAVQRLAYNNATEFLDINAGETKIDIVSKDSTNNVNPLYTETVTLTADERYVVFAAGNPMDTETDNTFPFGFYGLEGVPAAVTNAGAAEFSVFHASPDAPPVKVEARGYDTLIDSLHFADGSEYFAFAAENEIIDVFVNATGYKIASYVAPLSTLGDKTFIVFAHGVYNNANKYASFGLSAVFADGSVVKLPKADEPNYPYPVNEETPLLGSEIFFQDGYNLTMRNESVTNVLAYADMPGNKVLRLTPADFGARGFYYDNGRNMQENIDRVDTLYMRIRVPYDTNPVLAIMIADMLDTNPSQAEKDYGFQVNWPIPDTMYNNKWYNLAIPLPLPTKAEQDTAVARGLLDPMRARWRFADAWSGSYNIGPADPLWRDLTQLAQIFFWAVKRCNKYRFYC